MQMDKKDVTYAMNILSGMEIFAHVVEVDSDWELEIARIETNI